MNIGSFNFIINFYKEDIVINDSGFQESNLILDYTTRGRVDNISGQEVYKLDKINAIDFKKFTVRYNPNINSTYKIIYDNKTYEISFVNNIDNKNKFLEIYGKLTESTDGSKN